MRNNIILVLAIVLFCAGCQTVQSKKLTIATAANMQFAISDLMNSFSEITGIECETVISSSGKLTAQIQSGAPFDLFVSANKKYPDALFQNNLTTAPPKIYAHGKLALWSISEKTPIDINKLSGPTIKHIALANPKTAPYGEAAVAVLRHYGIFAQLEKKLVYGESIAQVNQFISSQAAEVGFTALSVVFSPDMKGKGKWVEIATEIHPPIEQGIVILKNSEKQREAQLFIDYLFSEKGKNILVQYGYQVN